MKRHTRSLIQELRLIMRKIERYHDHAANSKAQLCQAVQNHDTGFKIDTQR
jgi:phosphate uptake regulator